MRSIKIQLENEEEKNTDFFYYFYLVILLYKGPKRPDWCNREMFRDEIYSRFFFFFLLSRRRPGSQVQVFQKRFIIRFYFNNIRDWRARTRQVHRALVTLGGDRFFSLNFFLFFFFLHGIIREIILSEEKKKQQNSFLRDGLISVFNNRVVFPRCTRT